MHKFQPVNLFYGSYQGGVCLLGDGRRRQKVFEIFILETDGKSSIYGPVVVVADKIVPTGGEIKMLQNLLFHPCFEVGGTVSREIESL